ncbi:MAG: hypothetical protein IPJ71_03365 [Bdellovibrionales bacterium]|nr:hypothetical protein [Bdellovibrionales bacterium]
MASALRLAEESVEQSPLETPALITTCLMLEEPMMCLFAASNAIQLDRWAVIQVVVTLGLMVKAH